MFIGDGAKLVRDAFELAKEKAPAIIFIDELDAIGTKRFDSEKSGDREVQRTMLELLNQLDGFGSDDRIKVRSASFDFVYCAYKMHRSSPRPTVSTSLILRCFVLGVSTARSSSRCRPKMLEPKFSVRPPLSSTVDAPFKPRTEIHSRKMNVSDKVNWDELARSTVSLFCLSYRLGRTHTAHRTSSTAPSSRRRPLRRA